MKYTQKKVGEQYFAFLDNGMRFGPYSNEQELVESISKLDDFVESPASIQDDLSVFVESEKSDGRFRVVIIKAGKSLNGNIYPEDVLKRDYQLFEGTKAFAYNFGGLFDHIPTSKREGMPNGSSPALNMVGLFENVAYEQGKGIVADFVSLNESLTKLLKEAFKKGYKNIIGLSIDALGYAKDNIVKAISKVREVTLVTEPSAGGGFVEILASFNKTNQEVQQMNELIKKLREQFKLSIKDDADVTAVLESINSLLGTKEEKQDAKLVTQVESLKTELAKLVEAQESIKSELEKGEQAKKVQVTATALELALTEAKLNTAIIEKVKKQHINRVMTKEEIDAVVKSEQDAFAAMQESGTFKAGDQSEHAFVNSEPVDNYRKRIEGMLNNGSDFEDKPVKDSFVGFHEAAAEIFGYHNPDKLARLLMNGFALGGPMAANPSSSDRAKMLKESVDRIDASFAYILGTKAKSLQESTITTSDFSTTLGSSIGTYILRSYLKADRHKTWQRIANTVSAKDFNNMNAVIIGGLGDLSDVSENAPYTNIAKPSENVTTYAIGKKGNTLPISYETMVNDRVQLVRRWSSNLGISAMRTLNSGVMSALVTNAAMDYDSVALFHTTHANTTTSAFTQSTLKTGIKAMAVQTELSSGKIASIFPKYILHPVGLNDTVLEAIGAQYTHISSRTETVNNLYLDQFSLEPLVDQDLTALDANNVYLFADPMEYNAIDVAFLNGKQEPDVFVQEQVNVGDVFNADVITFKVRFIFAIAPVDHRPVYGYIVA